MFIIYDMRTLAGVLTWQLLQKPRITLTIPCIQRINCMLLAWPIVVSRYIGLNVSAIIFYSWLLAVNDRTVSRTTVAGARIRLSGLHKACCT